MLRGTLAWITVNRPNVINDVDLPIIDLQILRRCYLCIARYDVEISIRNYNALRVRLLYGASN